MSGLRNTLLVTGTDTGVGKTWVSTGLLRAWVGAGLRVAARKPAETGCESVGGRLQPADAAALAAAAGGGETLEAVCPYRFAEPLAPAVAAARAGVRIDLDAVVDACRVRAREVDRLLVEGAGGFLSDPQDIFKGDLVEVVAMGAYDASGRRFGMLGVSPEANHPVLRSGLVFVIDSASPIRFSRGGDALVRTREGYMNSGFDKLLDSSGEKIDSPGIYVEVEYSIDGGPFQVGTYSYDIVNGRSRPGGRPHTYLPGLAFAQTVEVKRVDVFDAVGNRFATLGVKIVSPRE